MSARAPWVLVLFGVFGLVLSVTVVWGLVGSDWGWVRDHRLRLGSPPGRDRERLLAALPAGSGAVVLAGVFLAGPDPVAATPLAVAAIALLLIAIAIGIHPDPFLPRWIRGGRTVPVARATPGPGPGPEERAAAVEGRIVTLLFGAACVPIGLGMSQVPGLTAVGLALAALGGLGVFVALRRRRV